MTGTGLGSLVLVGTPIGNREDLSPRALRAIVEADLLLCEDTRSPLRLVGAGQDLPPRVSCFVGNERDRLGRLADALEAGQRVVFVSEAGMPVWSDPGRVLVEKAWELGASIDVVPGPTAAATALCAAGFEAEGAVFVGFVPRSGAARTKALAQALMCRGASIFYEAGNRTPALLRDLKSAWMGGARRVLVARELTKMHQQLVRADLDEIGECFEGSLRGEVCVVLEGSSEVEDAQAADAQSAARALLDLMTDSGLKPRARAKRIAELTGLDAREIYERLSRGPA